MKGGQSPRWRDLDAVDFFALVFALVFALAINGCAHTHPAPTIEVTHAHPSPCACDLKPEPCEWGSDDPLEGLSKVSP